MNEYMNRFFTWHCDCGYRPRSFRNGITSHGCLSATFWCQKCKRVVIALFPLNDVVKEIPPCPKLLPPATWTEEDRSLLGGMNIILGEEDG